MRLLVIEDNEVDFRLIERALRDQFDVSREVTLQKGLQTAATGHFDLLILDLFLDDSHGYETFKTAHMAFPAIPILVLSGLDDDELAIQAVSDGAQDFIRKSRLFECPLDRIARFAIERHRVEDRARKAELQYRNLLNNLPTAAYTCDAQGLITYYNQRAFELWGRAPKLNDPEYRFTGSWRLFTPGGTPITHDQSFMAKTLQEKRRFDGCELLIERPDGQRRAVLNHTNPFFDENGELSSAINVLVDITSQRKAEDRLRESERFARSTVNSLKAEIAILDESGKIIATNKAWDEFASPNNAAGPDFFKGQNYLDVCDKATGAEAEIAKATAAGIRRVINRQQDTFELEYPCHSPTEECWFNLRVTPFEGDGPTRVVVLHENITSRKLAERLSAEQAGLRQAVAGMEQVLGVVGHELRTPLAALRAISEFLVTDGACNTAEAKGFLRDISEEVDRMSDTVNNLLEAARLNSGRARWNWSEVELADIAHEAVESIRPLVDAKKVAVRVELDGLVGQMLGDAEAIRRLLINLLSNARKHTAQGSIEITGDRYRDDEGSWVELIVKDTGCGIPPHVAARLGEAFALNSGIVGGNFVSGTGLGIAICKGIVKAHGGQLLIKSEEGKGTTVTARLRADLQAAGYGDTEFTTSLEGVAI